MSQTVHAKVQESLSALVDGEISELELRRLLKELEAEQGAELCQQWRSYHVGGSVARNEDAGFANIDLSGSISAVIASESEHAVNSESGIKPVARFWSYMGKSAVAASVAAAVLFTVGQMQPGVNEMSPTQGVATNGPSGLPVGFGAGSVAAQTVGNHSQMQLLERAPQLTVPEDAMTQTPVSEAEVRVFLQRVMTQHANQAAQNSNRSLMPYARVAPSDVE